jgi:hypothetical protein
MNCKDEFLKETLGKIILCATLRECHYSIDKPRIFILKKNYSSNDLHSFLKTLDFEYYEDFGSQFIDGTIWYTDGTWSDRCEYDGSEWWEYRHVPEIPIECQ